MDEVLPVEDRLKTLEERLNAVESVIAQRLPESGEKGKLGWRAIVGTFANDPLYEDAMRAGRQWRDAQRDEAEAES